MQGSQIKLVALVTVALITVALGQNSFRQAARPLKPVQKVGSPEPASSPDPPDSTGSQSSSQSEELSPRDGYSTVLDKEGRQLLQRFDDYLFDNLEKAYYHLSYAFKDAVKKTMDKCSCDAGARSDSPTAPPA